VGSSPSRNGKTYVEITFWIKKNTAQQKETKREISIYDGEVIPTIIYVEEREWRRKWLKWTSLFSKINRTIDVHFSKECGKEKRSWKGGVIGCSYPLLKNEEPLDCLKRMEKERDL